MFLKQLQEKKARQCTHPSLRQLLPLSVGERRLQPARVEPWKLLTYDFSRITSIMEERAGAYAGPVLPSPVGEGGVFPDNQTLHVVFLRHTDAKWKDNLSDLPEACGNESPPLESREPPWWSGSPRSPHGSGWPRSVIANCSSPLLPRSWRRTNRRSRTSSPAARRRSTPWSDAAWLRSVMRRVDQ